MDFPAMLLMFSPQMFLVTCAAVGSLGAAVLLLTRPKAGKPSSGVSLRKEPPNTKSEMERAAALRALKSVEPVRPAMKTTAMEPASAEPKSANSKGDPGDANAQTAKAARESSELRLKKYDAQAQLMERLEAQAERANATPHGAAMGAGALIAKVATLLPAGRVSPKYKKPSKPERRTGFQPGARFSRSEQAFLRIPIVLTGEDESGEAFREETCTVILLPQGAVIPMRRKVRTGERIHMCEPVRQKDLPCEVFGAQPGPDGRLLVEVEFSEPQKNPWPVSFPAWAERAGAGEAAASELPVP